MLPELTVICHSSDSVKRHLSRRHLSVLNLKFDFISDGGRTREEQIALSLKRHLFPHGDREPKAFLDLFFDAATHLEYFFQFLELSTKAAFAKAAFDTIFAGVLRGNTIRGNTTRNSERKMAL